MATLTEELFNQDARRELLEEILPFWRQRAVDADRGGFIGEMSNDLRVRSEANKGLILNGRILWTFSAVHRFAGLAEDQSLARRAYKYLTRYFLDAQHGGFYWELDPAGGVVDDKKKIYGQAFGVYALAEYHRTFGDPAALQLAKDVFHLIEKHSHDPEHGGYGETLARDWQPCEDVRLSDKDMNEKKSMNNHLHVLEAYTNLFRVWPDPGLAGRLRELIDLFLRRILNREKTHFNHFFDAAWTPKSDSYTFGHDIEGSWLLYEAAEVLGDPGLLEPVGKVAVRIAKSVLLEGLDADGGLFYEGRGGAIVNSDKEWWPQAEAVVGFYSAWQLSGNEVFRYAASSCWQFIQQRIVDRRHGEWFWKVSADGLPDDTLPKVSIWKCPYHNGRCCLEIIHRTQTVLNQRK